jgi:hypothetical protein
MNGRPYVASQRFFDAMKAANISKPLSTELHHIVPAGDAAAAKARDVLAKHGIGINPVANGMYLPNHKGRHITRYSTELVEQLNGCRSKDEVLTILNQYRKDLLDGKVPLYKKDIK